MTESNTQTLWYTRCPVPSPLSIAAQLGWLEEEFGRDGITVKSIIDSKDKSVRESHFDHRLAWSFRQGGNVPPIWTRSKGTATRVIALSWVDEFQAIIALPRSGIRSVRDLKGRRIGIAKRLNDLIDFHRATALKGLVSALSLEGLTTEAVEIVDLPVEQSVIVLGDDPSLFGSTRRHPYAAEIFALIEGKVDAIFVKAAEGIATANLLGAVRVIDLGGHPDPAIRVNSGTPRTLTVDEGLLSQRPDVVERLLGLVIKAGEWARIHPAETQLFVARETNSTEEAVRLAYGPELHLKLGVTLDPQAVAGLSQYKDFLRDSGFLHADFDVSAWIDRGPLDRLGQTARVA